jgi:HAD superfamily hydrolase (TIGR01549 family)
VTAFFFDFDNTLAALEAAVDWAASRVELEAYLRREGVGGAIFAEIPKGNLPLYEALRARLLMEGAGEAADALAVGGLARTNPTALLHGASAIIEAYELRGAERAHALPGATELLRALRAGNSSVAIVTSNSSPTIRRWLERQHPIVPVDVIVGRDAMLPLKPAPDSLLRALALCGAATRDAIFVGDSIVDTGAACAAGVRFYGIAKRAEDQQCLSDGGALQVFESPHALGDHLRLWR